MKKVFAVLFLLCVAAFGQGVRVGDPGGALTTTAVISGTTVIVPKSAVTVQFCNHPANAVPCSNKATTYTDATLGTPCSTSTQVVLDGTTTCIAGSDSLGNWGVWVASANYDWTYTDSGGNSFGPFYVTANSSPNTNAWSALTNPTGNVALTMPASHTTSFSWTATPTATNQVWSILPLSGSGFVVLGDGEVMLGNPGGGNPPPNPLSIPFRSRSVPTPPAQNQLACFVAGAGIGLCQTGATPGLLVGVCTQNCVSGIPIVVATYGIVNCAFDNATTANDWIVESTTVAGDCHDAGSSVPATTTSIVGRVLVANASAGTNPVLLQISR